MGRASNPLPCLVGDFSYATFTMSIRGFLLTPHDYSHMVYADFCVGDRMVNMGLHEIAF